MNSEVEKIKEDIVKTCNSNPWCDECPYKVDYHTDVLCSINLVFSNKNLHFTPEIVFSKLFKKAITKECKMEDCKLCEKHRCCEYYNSIPATWPIFK